METDGGPLIKRKTKVARPESVSLPPVVTSLDSQISLLPRGFSPQEKRRSRGVTKNPLWSKKSTVESCLGNRWELAVNKKGRDLSYDRAHGCRLCRRSDLFFLFLTACSHGLCLPGLCPFSLFLARQIPKTCPLHQSSQPLVS